MRYKYRIPTNITQGLLNSARGCIAKINTGSELENSNHKIQ